MKACFLAISVLFALATFRTLADPPPDAQETGAQCCVRMGCNTPPFTVRTCYTCCDNHCTEKVECQDKCDAFLNAGTIELIAGVDRLDYTSLADWYAGSPEFNGPTIGVDGAQAIDWAFAGTDEAGARYTLVVAADRLVSADMPNAAYSTLKSLILDALNDARPSVRSTACVAVADAKLTLADDGELIFVLVDLVLNDPSMQVSTMAKRTLCGWTPIGR